MFNRAVLCDLRKASYQKFEGTTLSAVTRHGDHWQRPCRFVVSLNIRGGWGTKQRYFRCRSCEFWIAWSKPCGIWIG